MQALSYNSGMTAPSFTPQTERLLDQAEALCARRASRLTEQRRLVLGLILDSPRPTGAYDLLDRLREDGRTAAPPTVYRALDFLTAQGLVHKIERLSAFVGCSHALDHADHAHHGLHAVQFLICARCRRTIELTDPAIGRALAAAASSAGFALTAATIEAEGICAECAADGAPTAPP
jgi:Fur family zinc uptake transcriptional regulator